MSRSVYEQILDTIGNRQPESGGILGAGEDGVISQYYFDVTGISEPDAYIPDVEAVNQVLEAWHERGIHMVGIVHSHQGGMNVPSCGDVAYGTRILEALDTVDRFYLPIVVCHEDAPRMLGYVLFKESGRILCKEIGIHVIEGGK